MNSTIQLILCAFGVSFLWMFLLWGIALKIKNYAIVDVGWGMSVLFYALVYFLITDGFQPKEFLILTIVVIWSIRLSSHLLLDRIIGHEEEGRYKKLREYFKKNIPLKFFLFFQAQAMFNIVLSSPFLITSLNSNSQIGFIEIMGFCISLLAIIGESVSDRQLKAFKANPANRGKVCDIGLWGYSRHPNYFFEFLIWVGLFLISSNESHGIWGAIAPLSILYTLLKFTGIPATEAEALRSRGDLYRDYQEKVSMFVPWPPKKKGLS